MGASHAALLSAVPSRLTPLRPLTASALQRMVLWRGGVLVTPARVGSGSVPKPPGQTCRQRLHRSTSSVPKGILSMGVPQTWPRINRTQIGAEPPRNQSLPVWPFPLTLREWVRVGALR